MGKFTKKHLMNFLQTNAGKNALRQAGSIVFQEMISAAKYFPESVVKAKKAYVTLNTIMGRETAERDRFNEGKKQIPELFTPLGIEKMINLFTNINNKTFY